MRILVAEDDRSSRRLITAMLDRFGCQVDIAEDGVEAVAAVRLMRYDLVLMDLNMPRLGGLEAARAIRRMSGKRAATPIVVLTGDGFADTAERCRAAGVNEVIEKPIAEDALSRAVSTWGERRPAEATGAEPQAAIGGELASRLGPGVFAEMVRHFREDAPRYLAEIDGALAGADWSQAAAPAHKLAGAAKAFQLSEVAAAAAAVEAACVDGDRPGAMRHAKACVGLLPDALTALEAKLERLG